MLDHNKPANLSQFSDFVQVPESANKHKHTKFKTINLIQVQATHRHTPEFRERVLNLRQRADAIRANLKKRGLKFSHERMVLVAYEEMLSRIEKELT